MSIRVTICPRCGKPSNEGLCGPCRLHALEWVTVPPRLSAILCPTCGSRKVGSRWSDSLIERKTLGRTLVMEEIRFHQDLQHPALTIEIRDLSSNRSEADLTITGRCYGIPVEGRYQVRITWGKEQCDRCSRISGSYYEGIIQVRGDGRQPTGWEMKKSSEIAYQAEDAAQQGGDRLSFVSSVDLSRDGLDIIVSSLGLGQTIVNTISTYFGAKPSSHPTLIGERDGKKLYRVTWLIRLPRIVRGDVIERSGSYYQVTGSDATSLRTLDLLHAMKRTLHHDETIRIIGNLRDAEEAMVTHRDGATIGILDPKTQLPCEVSAPDGCRTTAGGTVSVLRDGDILIVVGY